MSRLFIIGTDSFEGLNPQPPKYAHDCFDELPLNTLFISRLIADEVIYWLVMSYI